MARKVTKIFLKGLGLFTLISAWVQQTGEIKTGVRKGTSGGTRSGYRIISSPTGSMEAVSHFRLPQKVDCRVSDKDMPEVESIIVETDDPEGPFGAKEIREAALIPTAVAIANAIYDPSE